MSDTGMSPQVYGSYEEAEAAKQLRCAEAGLKALSEARYYFKEAGNLKTLARVRSAISSAKGAIRICDSRVYRARRAVTKEV